MDTHTPVNGMITFPMERENKYFKMEINMKEPMFVGKNKAHPVNISGSIQNSMISMLVDTRMIIFQEKDS